MILYREDECAHHSADQGREVEHRDHQATYFMILNTSIIIIKWCSLSQSFSFLFSLSQSPRADPEHEAIPRMGYPEWDALCALSDHSFPTITTTSTIVNFISKISSLRYIKEHPIWRSPSSCSIHLEPRKSSCWFSNLRCWYTKKTY